jgi:hypothetical protein
LAEADGFPLFVFCIEEVIGGVGGPGFLSSVDRITAGGRGFAALGVDALDGSGLGEDSVAFVAHDFEKEPGDGVGVGRRGLVDGLGSDTAAVVGFPGWSGKMFAERFVVLTEELGVWILQGPSELRNTFFADINLIALGVKREEESLAGGRVERRWSLLREEEDERKRSEKGKEGNIDGEWHEKPPAATETG